MICTIVLSLTLIHSDGHTERAQRHFTQASLEKFNKSLSRDWKPEEIGLPSTVVRVDDVDIEDRSPFTCGVKQGPKL